MDSQYSKLNQKLDALQSKHKDKNRNRTKEGQIQHQFYTRTVNLTKINNLGPTMNCTNGC